MRSARTCRTIACAASLLAAMLALAPPAAAAPPRAAPGKAGSGSEPPLNIAADNVSGSHGPEGDVVLLHGNVRITRERTVLTATDGRYLRAQGMLYLDGNVKMVDSTATVTCDHASYSERADRLELQGNVVVVDKNGTLKAPAGTYDRGTGRAVLTGGVTAQDGNQRMLSERATYLRDSSSVQARGRVRGYDDVNKIELAAEAIDYDRAHKTAVATQDPVLRATDRNGKTVEMRAKRLRLNTETRVAEAIDSVRVVRDTLQARADHALFDDLADHGWLTGSPRVWDNETDVRGDSIEVFTDRRVLKRVVVRRDAVMDYRGMRPGSSGELSRLTGERVDVYFTQDDIDSLVAVGNARNEYQAAPRARQTAERNGASGDTITVFFRDGKIDRARVEGRAKGEYRLAVADTDTVAARRERVSYDARRIEYIVPQSRIVLDQDAHLTYQDLLLNSRRVVYDVNRQTLVAEGNPQLLERGDKVTGQMMTYDLESRVGNIYEAATSYERGLYHGDRIRKATDNELDVMNGNYSTCDLPHPHYHFSAHYMKIYLKDKLVAKPVVFYIENVPLLALPFWVFPIKPGRHSGFLFPQFELGLNTAAGQFIRNAGYYWAVNDYMDFTVTGDYYQAEPSWVLRGESYYKLNYLLDGTVRGSYAKDERTGELNWDFSGDHAQELSPRTRLVARAQFVSSRSYSGSPQFGNTLAERLNRFLTSSVSLSHTASWVSFNAVVDRRQDLDADHSIEDPDGTGPLLGPPVGTLASLPNLTQQEPSISLALPTRTLGGLGRKGTWLSNWFSTVYFNLSSRFVGQRERQAYVAGLDADSVNIIAQRLEVRRALATTSSVSGSRRLFGWLNFAPRASGNLVVFDHDQLGNEVVPAGTWNAGVSMSSSFYGTFRPKLGSLVGVRHVVVPAVSFAFSPDFPGLLYTDSLGFVHNRFQGFDGISVSGFKAARMDFGLEQRFQAKLRSGDEVRRLDNLLSWFTTASYNLLYQEQGQAHGLSPINSSILFQPPGVANLNLGWVTDVYNPHPVRTFGYNVNLSLASGGRVAANPDLPVDRTVRGAETTFQDAWSLGLAYSYSGGYQGPSWASQQNLNAVARAELTPSWGLEYSTSFDITQHQIGTQRFAVTRDLHCWTASFTRTFIAGGEAEYYFRISVKDQRELFIERGTRSGSIGGIQ